MKLLSFLAVALFTFPSSQTSQQSPTAPQRDPQALTILRQSFVTMGGTVPPDSTATGTVKIIEGSSTESGNITILTRGTDQTLEQIQTSQGSTTVYSNLEASATNGSTATPLSAELAATSRSVIFPMAVIASALSNPDSSFGYVGLESINGLSVHHVRYWNSFRSQPKLQFLSEFTLTDIWVDAASGLPHRISQTRRAGRGSEPRIALDTSFSNYQKVGGITYPFLIQRSLNGSSWMTITIANVVFNTGLTAASFPVQ